MGVTTMLALTETDRRWMEYADAQQAGTDCTYCEAKNVLNPFINHGEGTGHEWARAENDNCPEMCDHAGPCEAERDAISRAERWAEGSQAREAELEASLWAD
jgi:hypothetical protein